MIVWLVSYPRSGNTLARLVLKQCFGFDTYSVYNDPLFKRRGIDRLLGQRDITDADLWRMATGEELYFVKTHRKHEEVPGKVVYIIRDGRDAYVSFARYRVSYENVKDYSKELEKRVGSEEWGVHERTWRTNGIDNLIRYDDLIDKPLRTIRDVLENVSSKFVSSGIDQLTSFDELHKKWPNFFRRGKKGAYRDEMPKEIQELFWKSKIHQEVMKRYGFA